jgi:hypothetical protein
VGEQVEGDLVGIELLLHLVAGRPGSGLRVEGGDTALSAARHRLVGAHHDALDAGVVGGTVHDQAGERYVSGGVPIGIGDDRHAHDPFQPKRATTFLQRMKRSIMKRLPSVGGQRS